MARWTETWLAGPGAAAPADPDEGYRGQRLGLPEGGPGSLAPPGRRLVAFLVDAVGSGLVARLVDPVDPNGPLGASVGLLPVVVLAVVTIGGLMLGGQTPGMRLLGLRLARLGGPLAFVPVCVRTALLLLLLPAVVTDRDGRGLHDRASRTAVVRA